MKKLFLCFLLPAFISCNAQTPVNRAHCKNPDFDKAVAQLLNFTVRTISADSLKKIVPNVLLLDAREEKEFNVSHLPNAQNVGYKQFNRHLLDSVAKETPIVVYCSVGYRSEKIGEKLQAMGYNHVYNLYGSIFEWVNEGNQIVNGEGKPTQKLHTYNASWGKWVSGSKIEKIY